MLAKLLLFTAVLVGCLLAAVIGLALWVRFTSSYNWMQVALATANWIYVRIVWRAKINKRLPFPPSQGAVIVCNHTSSVDPMFIQAVARRVVHWMVAREYVEARGLGWFFRATEVIPVNRGGVDTAATKAAIRLCEEGEMVGMFPEGRLNTSEEFLLPGRPGAALVALKARVPVLPCYLRGSPYDGTVGSPFRMRARAELVIGEPIDLSPYYGREGEKEVLQELTCRFLSEIARLAGAEDYQPQVAGRNWLPDQADAERSAVDSSTERSSAAEIQAAKRS